MLKCWYSSSKNASQITHKMLVCSCRNGEMSSKTGESVQVQMGRAGCHSAWTGKNQDIATARYTVDLGWWGSFPAEKWLKWYSPLQKRYGFLLRMGISVDPYLLMLQYVTMSPFWCNAATAVLLPQSIQVVLFCTSVLEEEKARMRQSNQKQPPSIRWIELQSLVMWTYIQTYIHAHIYMYIYMYMYIYIWYIIYMSYINQYKHFCITIYIYSYIYILNISQKDPHRLLASSSHRYNRAPLIGYHQRL